MRDGSTKCYTTLSVLVPISFFPPKINHEKYVKQYIYLYFFTQIGTFFDRRQGWGWGGGEQQIPPPPNKKCSKLQTSQQILKHLQKTLRLMFFYNFVSPEGNFD